MIPLPVVEPPSSIERQWRGTAHLTRDPAFAKTNRQEFMPGASDPPAGTSRRHFLQILGASMAMASVAGCRRPVERVMPFADRPEDLVPGVPVRFATAMPHRGALSPLLVKSDDGRPTKIEGNPEHPDSRGKAGLFEQASLLNLYDPDRSRLVRRDGQAATWEDFLAFCRGLRETAATKRIVVLRGESSSPTAAALVGRLTDTFGYVSDITYLAEGEDASTLGMQQAFGRPYRARYDFGRADVIVSLDADFLGPVARNVTQASGSFAQGRRLTGPEDRMSRLWVVESTYSVTGGMADRRRRMRSCDVPGLAAKLAAHFGVGDVEADDSDAFVAAMARDLRRAGSRALVVAGETQGADVHALCAAVNAALGSVGDTMTLFDTGEESVTPQADAMRALVADMKAGSVDALVILGVNPVYDAPADLDFGEALRSVESSVHVGLHLSETARAAHWHVPQAHFLEAWGDGRSWDGTLSVVQPLIAPLYDAAHSVIEVLHALASDENRSGYDLVRDTWRTFLDGDFESAFRRVLHDGYLPGTAFAEATPEAQTVASRAMTLLPAGLELVFRLDPTVLDGSFANNAWCQELPDPVTKIVWDNVAVMSPKTAADLGVAATYRKGRYYVDVVTLTAAGRSVDLPIWILPGHADDSISVTLGYGRDIATDREERHTPFWDTDDRTDVYAHGTLASGVGKNVSTLRDAAARAVLTGVQVEKTGETYRIVTTQDHGTLDLEARPLLRIGTLDEYRADPAFALESEAPTPGAEEKTSFEEYPMLWEDSHPEKEAAFRDSPYFRNQWGMTIDLNTCTGCGACIVACQAENNVQVVGKHEVGNGRELHWLRVDRYFVSRGDASATEEPEMVLQPVPCQHCENAPCEAVCPVAATVHSPDGTNQMIYNRCIGTRYCANNCPYKVRRFNFFNWSKTIPETVRMAQNPDVTVRSRGVMEKCSFCIHRVRSAQKRARLEQRTLRTDEVTTACQDACGADAIVFGDLNDPGSRVTAQRRNARSYTMLAELNVKPRVSYLARVRNPGDDLA